MKKIISLVLAFMLISVFCVPAFAEDAPIDCTPKNPADCNIIIVQAGNYIISQSCTVNNLVVNNKDSTLTIPENVTVTVKTGGGVALGTIKLFGTLDTGDTHFSAAPGHIIVGDTGNYIVGDTGSENATDSIKRESPSSSEDPHRYTTLFSGGNVAIIVGVACFAAGFLVAMFIFRKKKQPKGEE